MQSEIGHCRLIDLFLLLTNRRRRFRVSGLSMSPLFMENEEVIVATESNVLDRLEVNDIVVLKHPREVNLLIIKRIHKIIVTSSHRKQYFVRGDNLRASTDSRHFGLIDENLLIGKVICRFP